MHRSNINKAPKDFKSHHAQIDIDDQCIYTRNLQRNKKQPANRLKLTTNLTRYYEVSAQGEYAITE